MLSKLLILFIIMLLYFAIESLRCKCFHSDHLLPSWVMNSWAGALCLRTPSVLSGIVDVVASSWMTWRFYRWLKNQPDVLSEVVEVESSFLFLFIWGFFWCLSGNLWEAFGMIDILNVFDANANNAASARNFIS